MCGRFTSAFVEKEIAEEFRVVRVVDHFSGKRYNVSPGQGVPVVYEDVQRFGDQKRNLASMVWGLVPNWSKGATYGHNPINARAESMFEKPTFEGPARCQRCLIISDGFYEWKVAGHGNDVKRPFYIRPTDRKIFGYAGLWDRWKSPNGEMLRTCTIVTTQANGIVRPLHDRMPAIIEKKDEERWLDPSVQDRGEVMSMIKTYDTRRVEAYEVSRYVNKPENQGEEARKPVDRSRIRTTGNVQSSVEKFAAPRKG
jgi:putative SOS response-associated peptidase YedK